MWSLTLVCVVFVQCSQPFISTITYKQSILILNIFCAAGESTITDVPFQLGDPLFDYNVTVQVQVFDRIGDKTLFEINIKVLFVLQPLYIYNIAWQFIY